MVDLERIKWGAEAPTPGKHTFEFDFKYDGHSRSGTGTLKVDRQNLLPADMKKLETAILNKKSC